MKVKKNPKTLILHLQISKKDLHQCLEDYLNQYAEYGEDSFSEDLIGIISALEHAIVHLQIARTEGEQKADNECLMCGFYDCDRGCTCSSLDKWYACPIESEKPENKKALQELGQESVAKQQQSVAKQQQNGGIDKK